MLFTKEIAYYDFGKFRLDATRQILLKDGVPVALTHKAFQLLLILVKNSGRIVEKEEIISELWADSFVEESNLSQYIYVLRKILGNDADGNPHIETVTKRGFRFIAPVEEVPVGAESSGGVSSSDFIADNSDGHIAQPSPNGFAHSPAPQTRRTENKILENESVRDSAIENFPARNTSPENAQPRLRLVLSAVVFLMVVSVVAYFYNNRQNPPQTADSKTKSIAVLPFKTVGEESNNEKLGFGMADAIITRLGRAKQIPVRPTSAISRFTDAAAPDSVAIGRELGVDAVLEGMVQRDGDRVRVSVSLINVTSGEVLWAETFDERFTNIFALQDSISNSVARSLSINLPPSERAARPPAKTEAYQAYLLGVYFWNKRTKEDLQKGVWNFQQAIELDPNYAEAYAGLADCYNLLGYYRFADSGEMMPKARAAAEKALALNDSLAEAHVAIAFVQRAEEARRSLERAIELSPYSSTARIRYGWNLLRDQKPETMELVERQMRLAQEYDPLSHVSNAALCGILMFRRDFQEAVGYCEKSFELAPQTAPSRMAVADAFFFAGRHEDAIAAAKTEIETGRNPDYALGTLGHYYAMLNRRAEAEKILAELKSKAEKDRLLLLDLILISYALGRSDESIRYFKQAYEKRLLPPFMAYDPIWEQVNKDPEVKKVLNKAA